MAELKLEDLPGCCKGAVLRNFGQAGYTHVHGQTISLEDMRKKVFNLLDVKLHRTEWGPASGKVVVATTTPIQRRAIEVFTEFGFVRVGDDTPESVSSWTMTKAIWAAKRAAIEESLKPKEGPQRDAQGRFCKRSAVTPPDLPFTQPAAQVPAVPPLPPATGDTLRRVAPEGFAAPAPRFDIPDGTRVRAAYRSPYVWIAYQGYAILASEYAHHRGLHPEMPQREQYPFEERDLEVLPRNIGPIARDYSPESYDRLYPQM